MKAILIKLTPIIVGFFICIIPHPEALTQQAWELLVVFVLIIASVILKIYPLSVAAIIGLTCATIIGAIKGATPVATANIILSSFSSTVTWLILLAFMIARGFIKSGLGKRVAYIFIAIIGKKTLTLAYGLAFVDLLLSPAMPSITARGGGFMMPIIRSISEVFGSKPENESRKKIGTYLIFNAFIVNIITASMFITAMAGNPLAVSIARGIGVDITWTSWAISAFVPGMVLLLIMPVILYFIINPEIKKTPEAVTLAKTELLKMGKMKKDEIIMSLTFLLLLFLWIFGDMYKFMDSAVAAFIGLSVLFIANVLTLTDFKSETEAWDTFVWMSILITIAGQLNQLGVTKWIADSISLGVVGLSPIYVLIILVLVYFYSHYFFASASAHIAGMYGVFLSAGIAVGISGFAFAMILAMISNVFAATTHYGIGSAPVLYGTGYLTMAEWWKNGLLVSFIIIPVLLMSIFLWFNMLSIPIFVS